MAVLEDILDMNQIFEGVVKMYNKIQEHEKISVI